MNEASARVEEIRAGKPPLMYVCSSYNSDVLSVLGHVAQLILPPTSFKAAQLSMATTIFRLLLSMLMLTALISEMALVALGCPDLWLM